MKEERNEHEALNEQNLEQVSGGGSIESMAHDLCQRCEKVRSTNHKYSCTGGESELCRHIMFHGPVLAYNICPFFKIS